MTDVRTSRLQAALSGRYSVQAEAGEGGMATVYLAEDLKHGPMKRKRVARLEAAALDQPELIFIAREVIGGIDETWRALGR